MPKAFNPKAHQGPGTERSLVVAPWVADSTHVRPPAGYNRSAKRLSGWDCKRHSVSRVLKDCSKSGIKRMERKRDKPRQLNYFPLPDQRLKSPADAGGLLAGRRRFGLGLVEQGRRQTPRSTA